jgi:hypothetical protein
MVDRGISDVKSGDGKLRNSGNDRAVRSSRNTLGTSDQRAPDKEPGDAEQQGTADQR